MKNIGNVLWGIVLVLVGLIIGCNALGLTNINIFFDGWWTLFIVIPCFIGLIKDNEKIGSLIGILIGVLLLLACQDVINFDILWKLALPMVLVIIGLTFIFRSLSFGKTSKEINKLNKSKEGISEYCATFSSAKPNFKNEKFNGADLTAVFGGVDCNLDEAIIDGDVVINVTSIFGGVKLYVPSNFEVKIKSTSIFGGVDDKRKNVEKSKYTIYINAVCVFGGVDIV